mmetsp:Transcript_47592/g.146609  ORF Transcript_47592/g.146609 Transcript_47592/m.146609 type:complete len:466 (+) Transcript_47592:88-1485(+)
MCRCLPPRLLALLLLLAVAVAAAAAGEPGELPALPDEAQLLERESDPASFGDEHTSLLQQRILPSLLGLPSVPNRSDIPEASFAWALFQHVPAGPPTPANLKNDTSLEPPGTSREKPGEAALLKAAIRKAGQPTYLAPLPITNATPPWVAMCMGKDFAPNKYSSWGVFKVAVPQLVPFLVPRDHPNRTDVSVIIAPGGGGTMLAWENEGTDVAKWLNLLGISAFVLKYRVPTPNWTKGDPVIDAQRAVSLVRHMAPALGLNASRVGLFGASHGGFVASYTAFAAGRQYPRRDVVDDQSPVPNFLLLLYPEIHTSVFRERSTSTLPVRSWLGIRLSNLKRQIPIFAAVGSDDTCIGPESLYDFHMSLKKRGNPVFELNVYEGVGHGFTMCYRSEKGGWEAVQHEACTWMLRARRFIMWNVEGRAPADVEYWYRKTVRFDALVTVNSTRTRPYAQIGSERARAVLQA